MANKNALGSTKVRKSHVEYVNIYEVTESELIALESGGQSTMKFDVAISLLSVAVTCVVSLITSTFNNDMVKNSFLFVAIACFVAGGVLLLLSLQGRKSISKIVREIKGRLITDEDNKS